MLSENLSFHNRNLAVVEQQGIMTHYEGNMHGGRHSSRAGCASTTQSDPRMTVADILSTMANGSQTDTITPTTFSSLECFSTGILTQTTPTLTPTTLRNIEQTFIELQSVPPTQIEHQNQAGFVPPVVNRAPIPQVTITAIPNQQPPTSKPSQSPFANISSAANNTNNTTAATANVSWNDSNNSGNAVNKSRGTKSGGVRNMGGRKPSRTEKLSPEEEERRRVRRERNKMAAARCRKRRLDHTNLLVNETNLLEDKRSELQNEIQLLQSQKDELEFLLETHKVVCKMSKRHHNHHLHQHSLDEPEDIKPNIVELNRVLKSVSPRLPPSSSPSVISRGDHNNMENNWAKKTPLLYEHKTIQRPNSLPLTSTFVIPNLPSTSVGNNEKLSTITEATGISITTPSNGIFNFEALMEGGTGLTPIIGCGLTPMIPTCSNQQRSSSSDLSSPDSMTPSKLVSL